MISIRHFIFSGFLASTLAYGGMLNSAKAESLTTGVDIVSPGDANSVQQDDIIQQLKAAGVHIVRTGMPPNDHDIAFEKKLYEQGIKIELIVGPSYPANAITRQALPQFPGMRAGHPLSSADPQASLAFFQSYLQKLDANGIVLAGIELDNEINWADGNKDFPLPGEGKVFNLDDLYHDPEGQHIAQGFLKYIQVIAALKEARDHSMLNSKTPISSAGLYTAGAAGFRNLSPNNPLSKEDAVTTDATLEFLRANGLDNLVDAYAIHFYAWPGENLVDAKMRLETYAVGQCRPNGKPCWITEWGLADKNDSCPPNDGVRANVIQQMMSEFRALAQQNRLALAIVYDWNGGPGRDPNHWNGDQFDRFSIYRCGQLTKTGKLALSPI